MTDEQVQKKLNQLKNIANELAEEATDRYGSEGVLFFEAEGAFHFMSQNNSCYESSERQTGIVMSSDGYTNMDCGAW